MKGLNKRIRGLRTQLHLSQAYVANYLGVSPITFAQLENGNRKVSSDDVSKLGILFGVSADMLLHGVEIGLPATVFTHSFESLDESDQTQIINLIRFKGQMKDKYY